MPACPPSSLTVVALSGGVDSAVAALLLRDAGHDVQCLHMSNWEDDGYCDNAREFQDARRVCHELGMPLHRVNFAREYRAQVFAYFLAEYRAGRTPNPDVLCNREIKFGVMRRYAQRLGATPIATGHYARVDRRSTASRSCARRRRGQGPELLPARRRRRGSRRRADPARRAAQDRSARDRARGRPRRRRQEGQHRASASSASGRSREFLRSTCRTSPGVIRDDQARARPASRPRVLHARPAPRTGHRRRRGPARDAWYVAARTRRATSSSSCRATSIRCSKATRSSRPACTGSARRRASGSGTSRCAAQQDSLPPARSGLHGRCARAQTSLEVRFDEPQRTPTPGQFVVLYDGDRCLGGATIDAAAAAAPALTRRGLARRRARLSRL